MTDEDRDEEWITAPEAVDRIRMRHGVSHGKAPKIFSIAFASDEVRRIRDMGHGVYYPYPHGTSPVYEGDEFSWDDLKCYLDEHYPAEPKTKKRGGAPAKADWPAYEAVFQQRVEKDGWPDLLNENGWQRQADVERLLIEMAGRDDVDISETTARAYARKFLSRRGQ